MGYLQLHYIFDNAAAKLIITCDMTSSQALIAAQQLSIPAIAVNDMPRYANEHSHGREFHHLSEDAIHTNATLLYTPGTTGRPKGVLFDHKALLFVGMMFATEMHYSPQSRLLSLMPFTHSAPLNLTLVGGTLMASTHVIAPTFTSDLLIGLVQKERTTHFFGAPVAYLLTSQHPDINKADFSSMTHWIYGGG